MDWKVKNETTSLGIDLVAYNLEKVTPIKKTAKLDIRKLIEPELNQDPLRNCNWLDLGISLHLERGLW